MALLVPDCRKDYKLTCVPCWHEPCCPCYACKSVIALQTRAPDDFNVGLAI